eukprot:TRINITY_DN4726_c1_g1_i1.p1 TRINITY_DN4726_c1_g1~~TRINITY_DN4726_c1_g1_i1.p1  ORF type:complete len:106 (+),score=7.23 TRINITY_DN4726_c1_g1_i1:917-1234(+)
MLIFRCIIVASDGGRCCCVGAAGAGLYALSLLEAVQSAVQQLDESVGKDHACTSAQRLMRAWTCSCVWLPSPSPSSPSFGWCEQIVQNSGANHGPRAVVLMQHQG